MVYLFTMVVFGFLHSVLSVIFVVEGVISTEGDLVPVYTIPVGQDIPWEHDPCRLNLSKPECTFHLALNTLTSMLITSTPFTVGGVTFEPPNGTLGLPYHAIKHFSDQVSSSSFEEEHRRYCLPTLEPHLISCTEEPFNQLLGQTDSDLLQLKPLLVYKNDSGIVQQIKKSRVYQIATPYPTVGPNFVEYRVANNLGKGIFLVKSGWTRDFYATNASIIAGMNDQANGYGSLLYRMMYGSDQERFQSDAPNNSSYTFVAKCEFSSIDSESSGHSSWRQVDFTFKNGLLKGNVTKERCANPRGPYSGYTDIYFALEGAVSMLTGSDGYSKLFNEDVEEGLLNGGSGSSIFKGMSRLDATVNKIYHAIQTSYSQTAYKYAVKNPNVTAHPIMMTDYPHLYVIRISWTVTTYIGLALSLLITLNAYLLLGRWIRATYRFGCDEETWNLLRPVDLMSYSLAAWQDLIHDLHTVERRRMAVRGKTHTILREHPGWHPTPKPHGPRSTLSLVSTAVANNSVSTFEGKTSSPVDRGEETLDLAGQTTQTPSAERDLERGL